MATISKTTVNDKGEKNSLEEVTAEGPADFFIRRLNDFVEELKRYSVKERDVKIDIDAFIVKLQIVNNAGAFEAGRKAILNNDDRTVALFKDFCHNLREFFDDKQSLMKDLFSQDFNLLSSENQQQIYFSLLTVKEKMNTQNMMINLIKSDLETFLNSFKKVRRNKKSKALLNAANEIHESFSDCEALSSKILADLEENLSSLFPAEDDKVNLFIIKLKNISETFKESALKEVFITELMKSMMKNMQTINDKGNEKTEFLKNMDFIGRKIEMQTNCYREFKDLSEKTRSIMDNFKVDKIDGLSLENQNKIFFELQIVQEQRKSQIERLKSIKSESDKFLSEFNKMESSLQLKFTPGVIYRQIIFNKAINCRIQEASRDYFSTYIVLNNLTVNLFPSLNPEEKATVITEKLKHIRERYLMTKTMITKIKKIRESMVINLQSLKKEGTEDETIDFFNDNVDKLKLYEEHGFELKKNCEATDSVLNHLDQVDINIFTVENQRKIYVHLQILRMGMMMDIVVMNSLVSKWEQYLKDGDEFTSSKSSVRMIWEKLLEKEGIYLKTMDSFEQSLHVKVRKMNLFLNKLKKNTKGWAEFHLSPEDCFRTAVSTEDKSEIANSSRQSFQEKINQTEIEKDANKCDAMTKSKNSEIESTEDKETNESEVWLLAEYGKHAEMSGAISPINVEMVSNEEETDLSQVRSLAEDEKDARDM